MSDNCLSSSKSPDTTMISATDVIDLLSSSPPQATAAAATAATEKSTTVTLLSSPRSCHRSTTTASFNPPLRATRRTAPRSRTVSSDCNFLLIDSDSTIRLNEDQWEQNAAKRRRLSPRGHGSKEDTSKGTIREDTPEADGIVWADIDDEGEAEVVRVARTEGHLEDEIVFTSSLGHPRGKENEDFRKSMDVVSSDDSLPEDLVSVTKTVQTEPSKVSDRTARLLSVLDNNVRKGKMSDRGNGRARKPVSRTLSKDSRRSQGVSDRSSDGEEHQPTESRSAVPPRRRKNPKSVAERPETKQSDNPGEKEARAAQKAKEKERARELKRTEREQRAKDKEIAAALVEANKSKKDKKESTKEMIIDLPLSLQQQNEVLDAQIREMLKNIGLEPSTYESSIPNVIKWRRKVESRFDAEKGYRIAMPLVIKDENHMMILLSAKEFVDLVIAEAEHEESLDTHVLNLKSAYPGCTAIYMIEGLRTWMGKNKNARNRAFRNGVIAQDDARPTNDEASTSKTRRGKSKTSTATPYIDENMIEDALLKLQVVHNCLIHHTITRLDTAEWITIFTQHISTIPYRHDRLALSTAFCMESGQVKTGEDKADTFVKMLQEVVRVTPAMAYGIAEAYPGVKALVKGFDQKGPLALKDIRKCANRDGALTDGVVGQAISRRLFAIFRGRDEDSGDV